MFFLIEFFLNKSSYQLCKNDLIFITHDLFFEENILYKSTVSNFENK